MTPHRARIVLVASAVLLVALGLAWASWPTSEDRSDLQDVRSVPTTSTTLPPTTSVPAPTTTTAVPPAPPVPVRLRIPAIGVDATVVPVGLAPDRQMEIPPAEEVGWYELGPRPGEPGSAVLAAHVDFGGQRGAFFSLRDIPVGAEVLVDGEGGTRRFTVTVREQIPKAEVDLRRYFTADGPTRLTLITCGGAFDRGAGRYQDNLVITAAPVTP